MKQLIFTVIISVLIFGCQKEEKDSANQQSTPMMDPQVKQKTSSSTISISDDVLMEIDPAIKSYSDGLKTSLTKHDADQSLTNKSELVEAYVRFADYMQYESTVSPMKGKYRKALSLYRKALELDLGNSKIVAEIAQIEDIYRSMGRPIPAD
ncbi:MAG: hypothetical protein FJ213_08890 [Ignavibacteria bacterium]|nr:hypothetical protein [Ignavibacteria bacterium]